MPGKLAIYIEYSKPRVWWLLVFIGFGGAVLAVTKFSAQFFHSFCTSAFHFPGAIFMNCQNNIFGNFPVNIDSEPFPYLQGNAIVCIVS